MINQLIAIVKGIKNTTDKDATAIQAIVRSVPRLSGLSRTYQPLDEENGEQFPAESTLVQFTIEDSLKKMADVHIRLFDTTLSLDHGNSIARADVVVNGEALLADVPVTYLLFLEKKLVEMNAFINTLPTLDPSVEWIPDATTGLYKTPAERTVKTNKVMQAFTKAEATDRHPAQVETYFKDVLVGYWTKTSFSGALSPVRKAALLERVQTLTAAVKFAREKANATPVDNQYAGEAFFGYLFGTPHVAASTETPV